MLAAAHEIHTAADVFYTRIARARWRRINLSTLLIDVAGRGYLIIVSEIGVYAY